MNKTILFSSLAAVTLAVAPITHAADLAGKATFEGKAPKMKTISMDADAACAAHHQEPVKMETVVINEDGSLRNVFVYVKSGLEGKTFPKPTAAVELDQKGCQYFPHVFGAVAGQTLNIKNSDNVSHNVHAIPAKNPEINFGQPTPGVKTTALNAAEMKIEFKCEVHPWMKAYGFVLDHPFFAVTDDKGQFSIKGLPAGKYVVEAIHERYGAQTQTIEVGDKDAKELAPFVFKPAEKAE